MPLIKRIMPFLIGGLAGARPLLAKGERYSFTFTEVDSYPYHCAPDPDMKGTVVVTEKL